MSERRLRVAHVTTIDYGLRFMLLNQLDRLRLEGLEIVGVSSPGADIDELTRRGIRHFPVPMTRRITPVADVISLVRLIRLFRRERFDVVHAHNPKPGLIATWAARLAGVPIVVATVHGYLVTERTAGWKRKLYLLVERLSATACDALIFVSARDLDLARSAKVLRGKPALLLHSGVDVEGLRPVDPAERMSVRSSLGFHADSFVIGFVGRLVREKGVLDLVAAFRILADTYPHARLMLVGPIEPEKRDAIDPAELREPRIRVLGKQTDMRRVYSAMDCFALPSYREGYSRSLMEAASMGLPAITTNVRGAADVVEDERTGTVIGAGDVPALVAAISDLIERRDRGRQMGERARAKAEEQFDERIVVARIADLYRRLADAKDGSR